MFGRKKGFSLIELLVVIAIIAILAAILFPIMTSARRQAHGTSCMSNMKQISVALNLYSQSYSEKLIVTDLRGWTIGWPQLVSPYLQKTGNLDAINVKDTGKVPAVFKCPAMPLHGAWGDYGINYPIVFNSPTQPNLRKWSLGDINNHSKTMMICDAAREWDPGKVLGSFLAYNPKWFANWSQLENAKSGWARHNDGLNVAFLDGHARWMKIDAIWNNENDIWAYNQLADKVVKN